MSDDIAAALQRDKDQATIKNARKVLANAEAPPLGDLEWGDLAKRVIRLEVTLENVLAVIDRRDTWPPRRHRPGGYRERPAD
jgi:hypothetical protein